MNLKKYLNLHSLKVIFLVTRNTSAVPHGHIFVGNF